MTDVRLTATNPVDSSVVPVACNEKGELKLEEPLINSDEFVAKTGDTMTGNLHLGDGITLNPDGSAQLASGGVDIYDTGRMIIGDKITLDAAGTATFAGEIDIGNRDVSSDSASGIRLAKESNFAGVYIQSTSSASGDAFSAYRGTYRSFAVEYDGSAEFAGDVQIGATGASVYLSKTPTCGAVFSTYDLNKGSTPGSTTAFAAQQWNGSTATPVVKVSFDGSAEFSGAVKQGEYDSSNNGATGAYIGSGSIISQQSISMNVNAPAFQVRRGSGSPTINLRSGGSADFAGDVIVGSRGQQWMIVESNGLAHLVAQTRSNEISTADLVNPDSNEISTADLVNEPQPSVEYPPLRDIPGELTMVEEQLQKVLEKLRMVPEAGWEVWDGSD